MTVAQRLFAAVIPAVLGVLAMAGLAYWGQRGREIPEWLLIFGILAAVASLVLAWRNTRYVAQRIDALSRRRAPAAEPATDELDAIERALGEAEARGATREHAAETLVREYAGLLSGSAAMMGRRLDEVRLPLHILLASPFGELNENQEEMIGAAQTAAEAADAELRSVRRIVDLDAGHVESRPQLVRPRDLLEPVLAAVESRLRQAGAVLEVDLPPMLPHAHADPQHAREALSIILARVGDRTGPGSVVRVMAQAVDSAILLRISADLLRRDEPFPLAERLLRLQGARLSLEDGATEIRLPVLRSGG